MRKFKITGMSCAACSARIEKAVSRLEGVDECSVNLLTNSMAVLGAAADSAIINAVKKAGYGAVVFGKENKETEEIKNGSDGIKLRLIASLALLVILMYFSMGNMLGLSLPPFFKGNLVGNALLQMLLSAAVLVVNQRFFISGFKSAVSRAPNMDTLVALGSGAAFAYSCYSLFLMTANSAVVAENFGNLYFESAAMILTLITVGKMLEAYSKGKTTNAIKSLMDLAPKTATLIVDGVEQTVGIEQIKKGDIFVVRAGQAFPADAVITQGVGAVDEASLTGESLPVDKKEGDSVSAATVNLSGVLYCRAVKTGEDTTLSQIVKMVSDAAATKAPISKIADRISGVFVPIVLLAALITAAVWLLNGSTLGFAVARGISVLVISCPCALGLATPVAIMVGSGVGARNGILFKNATALQNAGEADIIVLDKTGTVTLGKPIVTDILPINCTKEELLETAASIEKNSTHPLAFAINGYAQSRSITVFEVNEYQEIAGGGVQGVCEKGRLTAGNAAFISKRAELNEETKEKLGLLNEQGKTAMIFSLENTVIGIIAVADKIKEDSAKAIAQLKADMRVVMLTGDNEKTARAVADKVGISEVISEVLPEGKLKAVQKLKMQGKVIMVGDGINDAPALTVADVGIAIGAGTDVAIDAADIVLVKNSLRDAVRAVNLSRKTLRNIKENLFWSFFYNAIGIPLAAGVFINALGWQLSPIFGAAAMSISSFCVVSNALRLNLANIDRSVFRKKRRRRKNMKIIMKIDGMMCPHCSGRVKQALEALASVDSAYVSHERGTAEVVTTTNATAELTDAVTAAGYKVLSVEKI